MPEFDLIVVDEAHHSVAGQWAELIASQPRARILGVTATPERLDGRGLGREAGGCYDVLVLEPSVEELTALGFLVPFKVFAPPMAIDLSRVQSRGGDYRQDELAEEMDRPSITGDAVKHYEQHAARLPTIAFCASVQHAEHVALAFREAGWRAVCGHGGLRPADRDAAIGGLATGAVQVLTTCDLVSEGLDVPIVGAVSLLRPTQSLVLHMQQIGRGLRTAPGKQQLVVLDHVGNSLRHGLPDSPREWTLLGKRRRQRDAGAPATWRCPECFAVQHPARVCRACGFVAQGEIELEEDGDPEQVDGQLEEIDAERIRALRAAPIRHLLRPDMTRSELDEIRLAKGYKPGWTFSTFRELQAQAGARAA